MRPVLYRARAIRLGQAAILVALVLLLEWLARTGQIDAISLAPPTEMVRTLSELLRSGVILNDIWQTAYSTFLAFALATATGIPVGWVLWRWNEIQRILDPYLISLYAAPLFVFYPMLVAVFGVNRIPIVLIAFALSIVAIIINTANGFAQVDDVYRKVGRSFRLTRFQSFVHVAFPAAVPYIFTGLKLGFIYAMIGVIASEFILSNAGLGYQVAYNYTNFATSEMYATMLLVILIAVLTNFVLVRTENRLYQRSVTE